MAGIDFAYGGGEIVDLPAAEAKQLIRMGRAEAVKQVKPKQKPVTVQEVKAETRPVTRKRSIKK